VIKPWRLSDYILITLFSITLLGQVKKCHAVTKPEIDDYVHRVSSSYKKTKVDHLLISSIIFNESSYQTNAISHKGAEGLMQLMEGAIIDTISANPHTCKGWTVETVRNNWRQNVWIGIAYFAQQLRNNNGDVRQALTSYNYGHSHKQKRPYYALKVLKYYKLLQDRKTLVRTAVCSSYGVL
jgi:soluble lytic murein transglycosylase-like protein